jgi:hypothetical protein
MSLNKMKNNDNKILTIFLLVSFFSEKGLISVQNAVKNNTALKNCDFTPLKI